MVHQEVKIASLMVGWSLSHVSMLLSLVRLTNGTKWRICFSDQILCWNDCAVIPQRQITMATSSLWHCIISHPSFCHYCLHNAASSRNPMPRITSSQAGGASSSQGVLRFRPGHLQESVQKNTKLRAGIKAWGQLWSQPIGVITYLKSKNSVSLVAQDVGPRQPGNQEATCYQRASHRPLGWSVWQTRTCVW